MSEPISILIVEDQYIQTRIYDSAIKKLSEEIGVSCDFVLTTTVRQASVHLNFKPFDAVLLDLNLADAQPGEELIKLIRKSSQKTWIVVLSGVDHEFESDRVRAIRELKPDVMLSKPEKPALIAQSVLNPWIKREVK